MNGLTVVQQNRNAIADMGVDGIGIREFMWG